MTFIETPPLGAILYAKLLPPRGGDTCWANMQAAYEGLSKPLQRFLVRTRRRARFRARLPGTAVRSRSRPASDKAAKALEEHPPVIHPVVRTHPETGADGLFVNYGFTERIKGLRRNESDALLDMLFVHIQKPEFQVRWRWKPNAIAFWDNRITQHYAVNDYLPNRRVMHRATILGDRPITARDAPPSKLRSSRLSPVRVAVRLAGRIELVRHAVVGFGENNERGPVSRNFMCPPRPAVLGCARRNERVPHCPNPYKPRFSRSTP